METLPRILILLHPWEKQEEPCTKGATTKPDFVRENRNVYFCTYSFRKLRQMCCFFLKGKIFRREFREFWSLFHQQKKLVLCALQVQSLFPVSLQIN